MPPQNRIEAVRFGDDGLVPVVAQGAPAELLEAGAATIAHQVGEDAAETAVAATAEDGARLTSEAADLSYHLLVPLEGKHLPFDRVLEELDGRAR